MGMIELVPVSGMNPITQLYQWDLDRQVMIWTKEEGIEVHFAQTGDTEALVVQTDAKDGYFVANIPNIQLQNTRNLTVYIVKDDVTVASCTYSIAKREKPTDYVYTETDVKRFEDLEKRIEVIEKNKNENNEHPNNKEIHVTPEEKQAWNNKSNFSGSYNDLTNKPEIPKAPVQSVNGKSGDVLLNAEDVGARPNTWTPSAEDVGAEPSGTAQNKVSDHNTSEASHNDIRLLISELANRLNALADSDDTTLDQMSEVVAYIKSNKTLIDAITTNKINVSDIVNDYATNVSNKPVSAAVAVRLKALIDAISVPTKTSQLKNDSGFLTQHQDISGLAPKATTLSGYGITDGATKEQVNQLSQEIVDKIDKDKITQDAGNSEELVMSQKGVTELVNNALGTGGGGGSGEYEIVDSAEEMTDTSKSYILRSTGTLWAYSDKTVVDIQNQFVASEAKINHRISGGGVIQSGYNGVVVTNAITVPSWASPYTVKISGITPVWHSSLQYFIATSWRDGSDNNIKVLADSFAQIVTGTNDNDYAIIPNEKGEYVGNIYKAEYTNATQVRFSIVIKNGTAITAADIENLFIEFVPKNGTKTIQEWQDTGVVPEDTGGDNYVDLLVKINANTNKIEGIEEQLGTSPTNSGAVWYAIGDSITKGRGVDAADCWVSQVMKYNGYDTSNSKNLGISGLGFAKTDPNYSKTARNVVDENTFTNVNLVTIAIGINDWKEVFSIDTIKSEMGYCFEKILTDNPYCKIFFITPLNISIKGNEGTNWALGYRGSDVTGGTLQDFINTQKEVCEQYGIQIIDMANSSVINKKNINTVLSDGVHPDTECHKALGKELARRITFA